MKRTVAIDPLVSYCIILLYMVPVTAPILSTLIIVTMLNAKIIHK